MSWLSSQLIFFLREDRSPGGRRGAAPSAGAAGARSASTSGGDDVVADADETAQQGGVAGALTWLRRGGGAEHLTRAAVVGRHVVEVAHTIETLRSGLTVPDTLAWSLTAPSALRIDMAWRLLPRVGHSINQKLKDSFWPGP